MLWSCEEKEFLGWGFVSDDVYVYNHNGDCTCSNLDQHLEGSDKVNVNGIDV